ncbi:4-hydroxy-3-methylbut-2-enyl diphosphate reductase [Actinoplanes sp. NPDC051851]|uniref:4-hydroxy-3-methylbut-2-enyl diphosphate reductase n=1 Tax=Actinoplanes sp. NPDC051851 TaxID=3154753 RepID=UPI003421BF99
MTGRVLLAAPRGFCAGVDRAVQAVRSALSEYGPPVYVRHAIVHNTHVIAQLEAAGAVFTDDLDEVPPGSIVVFSAHGVSPQVREHAHRRSLSVVDATCPLVSKVHAEARRYARDDHQIVLIGHHDHIEVSGTRGHAPEHIHVVDPDDPAAVGNLVLDEDRPVVWLSQTTLAVGDVEATVERLRTRFPHLRQPPSDDVCYASTNRQNAIAAIAARCDLVLVVGSPTSSNSLRLVTVAQRAGARAAHLVDSADQLDPRWLEGVGTIGVTSGASAPEHVVHELLDRLAGHGWSDVEQIGNDSEDVTFGSPPMGKGRPGPPRVPRHDDRS